MKILGISAYYHDAAACLVVDGKIVAAAQEERFTRKKNDPAFPKNSISYCFNEAGISVGDLDAVVFYDKPFLTFERLLETYFAFAPRGFLSFLTAMPSWLKEKLFLRSVLTREFQKHFQLPKKNQVKFLFSEHHLSHAASAFFASPHADAAVLCMDGVGEWATTSAWAGADAKLEPLWEIRFPHSLGLLYSAFTYYAGFKVNSGEYKLMGLAPYGRPIYTQKILDHLIDIKEDGSFRLNLDYFDYCTGLKMTNARFHRLFDGLPRQPESPLTQKEMDLAASIQKVTEEVVLRLSRKLAKETGKKNLCLAGGVALNCVANGRLLREGPFEKVWVQPAAGDAGGALGAALAVWHQYYQQPRQPLKDQMEGSYLGPSFSDREIEEFLSSHKIPYQKWDGRNLYSEVAKKLAAEKVVGWFQGRMEYGPRALGSRSILGDPRSEKMQSVMNLKIKYRESFRPFAPAVLKERASDFFDISQESPYMLFCADVRPEKRRNLDAAASRAWGIELLNIPKSQIPAVTHVDYSARVQTVDAEFHPPFHGLLKEFEKETGCPVLVNTSFNVRGEPIVCSPEDAYRCFVGTEMDVLVLGNYIVEEKVWKPEKRSKNLQLD
ncbi:carbamoyltransferase [bacterium]|nr:carbamoyltransferase [bacterium]